jgi:AAA+ ATPase superfamily predicted ATPase
MIDNPFITYGYESAAFFCDRKTETRELVTMLTNGNHVALISPRRMGKTGLIRHSFAQKEVRDQYYTFLIDIYATKNLQDMVYRMGQGIVNRLKSRGQSAVDGFLRFVTSLRTGISFDGQGNASWNIRKV